MTTCSTASLYLETVRPIFFTFRESRSAWSLATPRAKNAATASQAGADRRGKGLKMFPPGLLGEETLDCLPARSIPSGGHLLRTPPLGSSRGRVRFGRHGA